MRYQGKITTWKDDQGFGFITPSGDSERIFVHIKSFSNRKRRPVGQEIVTYELTTDPKGRAQAENVAFVGDRSPVAASFRGGTVSYAFAGLFLGFVAASVYTGKLPLAVLGLYFGASTVAFLAYALDKSAARRGRWRTQETTLHLFSFIGGWPGALVAQNVFRHKSKKQPFKTIFWITAVLNCGALGWLFSPSGSAVLRSVLGEMSGLTQ
jgi:uncharacterized membrane protein YsdA (DUF1294 family)/cold shock CspA family protein